MILKVIINDQTIPIEVPESMLEEGEDFFRKIDRDMDNGWQMSRDWVDNPDPEQRCRIAADKILTAVEKDNQELASLMAAYILKRAPDVRTIDIDTGGDMNQTEIRR